MRRIATIHDDKGRVTGIIHGPDAHDQKITVNGRVWRFDFDEYCGPLWLRKDGEPRKNPVPTSKAVWAAFEEWLKRYNKGKRSNREPSGEPIKLNMRP